jgi:hypothetical protein
MHKTFRSQKGLQFGQTPSKKRKHTKCEVTKGCPNYFKESNHHKIDSKVHQVNKAKANEHKG